MLVRVVAPQAIGDKWLVTAGPNAGDRLIVEGTDKVQPDDKVRPVPIAQARLGAAVLSRYFIERPIFAWVIAIGIMLAARNGALLRLRDDHWEMRPTTVLRFNGQSSYEIHGPSAPDASSGEAMAEWGVCNSS